MINFRVVAEFLPPEELNAAAELQGKVGPSKNRSPRRLMTGKNILGFIVCVGLAASAGAIGAVGSLSARDFYESLAKPAWAPPGWLFGPVWTTLYFMMGIAAWLVWRARGLAGAKGTLTLFVIQLITNALWSWLFFVWRRGDWAFAEIILLWGLIVALIAAFWRIRAVAGALLLPYLAWVTFAAFLCFTVWQLNPDRL